MITSQQAQDIVLNHCHSSPYDEQFAINRNLFTGKRRDLQHIQVLLNQNNIMTEIVLVDKVKDIVSIDNSVWFEEDIKKRIKEGYWE